MQKDFDYNDVPNTFSHCIYNQCVRADECLRHKIMAHTASGSDTLTIVNPAHIPIDGKKCTFFFADRKSRFALGITHLLDNIPHSKALVVKNEIRNYFRRTTYYRIRNKERLINPTEQAYIRQVLINNGIKEEPLFDKYVEMYEWQ